MNSFKESMEEKLNSFEESMEGKWTRLRNVRKRNELVWEGREWTHLWN
jgi:hypothetical protein